MSNDLQKLSIRAIRSSRDIGSLKNHLNNAYEEIGRLQVLNNNRSAEVVQLNTELQNQQLAHHTNYQLIVNEKNHIITEYNKIYNLYQIVIE
jgi:regulator of replication initiation timing